MGYVNLQNMEDGQVASANVFNERFGAITDVINGNIDSSNIKNGTVTQAKLAPNTLERMWPVGSVYMNADDNTNPGTLIGFGTWELFSAGRMLVGVKESDSDFNAAGKTGGTKNETLTLNQIPSHNHTGTTSTNGNHTHTYTHYSRLEKPIHGSGDWMHGFNDGGYGASTGGAGNHNHTFTTNSRGGGQSHNNMSPYITVYMWRRTA